MTKEELDALEELLQHAKTQAPEVLGAIRASIHQAREALELREALGWMAESGVYVYLSHRGVFVCRRGDGTRTWDGEGKELMRGEGATPLEAIQNARRGK